MVSVSEKSDGLKTSLSFTFVSLSMSLKRSLKLWGNPGIAKLG
jgi:hypothetical protein